jgi:hypothetical protein
MADRQLIEKAQFLARPEMVAAFEALIREGKDKKQETESQAPADPHAWLARHGVVLPDNVQVSISITQGDQIVQDQGVAKPECIGPYCACYSHCEGEGKHRRCWRLCM